MDEKKVIITISEDGSMKVEIKNFTRFELLGLYRYMHRKIEYDMLISESTSKKKRKIIKRK